MEPQATQTMKADSFGRVERVTLEQAIGGQDCFVRRVACGGRLPGSGFVARRLLARERRALLRLEGLESIPKLMETGPFPVSARPKRDLQRSYLPGVPLYAAKVLPEDFFERLEDLVRRMHTQGVCHNDLHKEGNILVAPDGSPALIDFQLASLHGHFGRAFDVRSKEDLRHVAKHHRRYLAQGRSSTGDPAAHLPHQRSTAAALWMRWGKPVYNFVTRRLLHTRDGEPRRDSKGPWPRWGPALGSSAAEQVESGGSRLEKGLE